MHKFHKVEVGGGFQQIADSYGISLPNFYAWNPAIGNDCAGLQYGYYVCVGKRSTTSAPVTSLPSSTSTSTSATPTPTQSGMTDGCTKFHLVVEGEYCQEIADKSGISLTDFEAWNPAIGSDCAALQYGYYVCVGKSSTAPMPATFDEPSSTAISDGTTPTPVQSGIK